jgi:hypothetical protein
VTKSASALFHAAPNSSARSRVIFAHIHPS